MLFLIFEPIKIFILKLSLCNELRIFKLDEIIIHKYCNIQKNIPQLDICKGQMIPNVNKSNNNKSN